MTMPQNTTTIDCTQNHLRPSRQTALWLISVAIVWLIGAHSQLAHADGFTKEPDFPDYFVVPEGFDASRIVPPAPKHTPPAQYPRSALRRGLEGSAKIAFLVEPDGTVSHVQAVEATNKKFA